LQGMIYLLGHNSMHLEWFIIYLLSVCLLY
jgi:hypothetical protein